MNSFLISLFLTCLVSNFAQCAHFDTQAALTIDQFRCLSNQSHYFVGHVYDPAGFIDETGIQNMKYANQAGFYVEAYMSPYVPKCLNCPNVADDAADQVNAVMSRLKQEFPELGEPISLWIAIERGNWSTNQTQNQQFVVDLLSTAVNAPLQGVGVMTSQSTWTSVVGNSFTEASGLAQNLWYVNWNGKPDFSGFTPFGGWNFPIAHQYAGGVTTNNCTQGLPLDYSYGGIISARRKAQMAKRRSARLHKFARN